MLSIPYRYPTSDNAFCITVEYWLFLQGLFSDLVGIQLPIKLLSGGLIC